MENKLSKGVRIILLNLLLIIGSFQTKAGTPDWSVNSASYQYTMTVTAVLDVNCTLLENPNNILGAFVNGECRGKVTSQTIYDGKYMALITIYSNLSTGESVSFKIYDSQKDVIHNTKNIISFENNAKHGSLNSPYSIITNYKPTNISISSLNVNENANIGTLIGLFTTADTDATDTHGYALVSGNGDSDNSKFSITGDGLYTNTEINYETKTTYFILVKSTDNKGCSFVRQFTVSVVNKNDSPTDLYLSKTFQAENTAANTTIGAFTTVDEDNGDNFTYSLVAGGVDNDFFKIEGNALKNKTIFDFEVKNTFYIRVKTTDSGGASFERNFVINCSDINDAPTDFDLSSLSINENLPAGTIVGNFSTTDQDAGDSFTYSFVKIDNSDNGSFVIVGNQLKTIFSFDYESKRKYYIYIQTKDNAGAFFEKQLIITINDANDAPTGLELTNQSILEGKPPGTVIGSFITTDPDTGNTHAYSLVGGKGDTGNDSFNISGSNLVAARSFSYRSNQSFSVLVEVVDGSGGSYQKQFMIYIKDVNNTPTNITLSSNTIVEGAPLATVIGSFTTTDADIGDKHNYVLASGTGGEDNAAFVIVDNVLKTNAAFNFESKSSYSILIKSTDADGMFFSKQFIITITNANDAPHQLNLDNFSIKENAVIGTLVGVFSTMDEDVNNSHTYSLINSNTNDNSLFKLNGNKLESNRVFDFEAKLNYQIEVKTDDGNGGALTRQFDITVIDENDPPTSIILSNNSIDENKPKGTNIGVLSSTDQDSNDSHTYSLIFGSGSEDNGSFAISGNYLTTNEVFNYNSKSQYSVLIQSEDKKGGKFVQQFIVSIQNKNDAPTAINLDADKIEENTIGNTYIGTFTTVDEDVKDKFNYFLVAGTGGKDNESFKLETNKLYSISSFDFEKKSSLEIRVRTQDSLGASFESSFIIEVVDVNERPVIEEATFAIQEDKLVGEEVGFMKGKDVDKNQILSYSILSADTLPFSINSSTGQILLEKELDYENMKLYSFEVMVTDDGTEMLSDTAKVVINILDTPESGFLPANNYLSPNGDGKNDFWEVENVDLYKEYELRIFNGSGELVYHKQNDYQNEWDGTFNGKTLPSGYYMYYFKKDKQVYKGILSIIR